MEDFAKGEIVTWSDPWFYPGQGVVVDIQTTPHEVIKVRITSMVSKTHQYWVGRTTWILAGYIKKAPDFEVEVETPLFWPTNDLGKCAVCNVRHHPGRGCKRWRKMTPKQRREWADQNNL